jgi:hypothetical protein
MIESDDSDNLDEVIAKHRQLDAELSFLFGAETVAQARQIDVADVNMNKEMTAGIGAGMRQLKQLRGDPRGQLNLVRAMPPGLRLLLCMWVLEMDLLDKIQHGSYIE